MCKVQKKKIYMCNLKGQWNQSPIDGGWSSVSFEFN